MALSRKGEFWYGTSREDLEQEVRSYSQGNTYLAAKFASPRCECGSETFKLQSDEEVGAVRRECAACGVRHLMGDSDEYADQANFDNHICMCDSEIFELAPSVALYAGSNDVRWFYVGCRCISCNLVGVFVDYKCEAGDAYRFLEKA